MRFVYHTKDVTAQLKGQAETLVSNELFGDPSVGTYKFLYAIEGQTKFVLGGEGDVAHLDLSWNKGPSMCAKLAPLDDFIALGKGLEIGGPSLGLADTNIYTKPASLDNTNFSTSTLWNTSTKDAPYQFQGKSIPGTQFLCDASRVEELKTTYDFVFASHVLEHMHNPLRALESMKRCLRPGGYIILVLPWKEGTFDHRRPITPLKELVHHYETGVTEDASILDHVTDELLAQYDFVRDPDAKNPSALKERCKNHSSNRAFHVHVFDFRLLDECFRFCGVEPIYAQLAAGMHQVVVGKTKDESLPRAPCVCTPCVILYATHELNERALFFLRYGVFRSQSYHFVFVFNGLAPSLAALALPDYLTCVVRENVGYDFGAWGHALAQMPRRDAFRSFVFVNNSVLGPFVEQPVPWPRKFLDLLETKNVRLAGVSTDWSNVRGEELVTPHVQSFVMAMPHETMEWLRAAKILPSCKEDLITDFTTLVERCEIGASSLVLQKGFNLRSLMPFEPRDYRDIDNGPRWSHTFNHTTPASLFASKEAAVFVKANRNATLNWIFEWPQTFPDRLVHSVLLKGAAFDIKQKLEKNECWVSVERGFVVNGAPIPDCTLLVFRNHPLRVRVIPQFL